MADLKSYEKSVFEKLFDRGGYVLDFTNRTFEEFFREFNIDIDSDKYSFNGQSKMKRLRAFWEIEQNEMVGKVLSDLLEYAQTIEEINVEDKNRALLYIKRLLGNNASAYSLKEDSTEEGFLKKEFSEVNLSVLKLGTFEETITQRIKEIQKCLNSDSSLSVIFLCGSTLEGILLHQAKQNIHDFNTAIAAPKTKEGKVRRLQDWSLNNLIDVAYEKKYIDLDVKKYSHALKDFRNFIHPFQQYSLGFNPDKHTARISWQVVKAAIDDLTRIQNKKN